MSFSPTILDMSHCRLLLEHRLLLRDLDFRESDYLITERCRDLLERLVASLTKVASLSAKCAVRPPQTREALTGSRATQ